MIDPITLFTVGAPILGGLADRLLSQGAINRQNKYNHPLQQVRRLREAGLPMAAMSGSNTGNQASLPESAQLGGKIQQGIATSQQLEQIKLIKAETRSKNAQANRDEAEANWLLRNKGETYQPTNLTDGLEFDLQMKEAQKVGQELGNKIQSVIANNQQYRTGQENREIELRNAKTIEDIKSTIQNRELTGAHIEGAELDNRIKKVVAEYQPKMSAAQLEKLYKENGLIGEHIKGAQLDNAIKEIDKYIKDYTKGNQIALSDMDLAMKELEWDKIGAYFQSYKQWQQFVDEAQKLFRTDASNFNPIELAKRLSALFYTTLSSATGASPNAGQTILPKLGNR